MRRPAVALLVVSVLAAVLRPSAAGAALPRTVPAGIAYGGLGRRRTKSTV